MKRILSWWAEILIVGGLLYTEHYALAAVALYFAVAIYGLRQEVDHLRATTRTFQLFNETRLAALVEDVPQETLDRHASEHERDPEMWESLKMDAAKAGITLRTTEETRRIRAQGFVEAIETLDFHGALAFLAGLLPPGGIFDPTALAGIDKTRLRDACLKGASEAEKMGPPMGPTVDKFREAAKFLEAAIKDERPDARHQ